MKKLIWFILVLIFTCIFHTCNGQNSDNAVATTEVIKVVRFNDLTDREKWVLLDKIEEAYNAFKSNFNQKINRSSILIYMEEENPQCEWTGKHINGKDGKLIRHWTVHREHILKIFNL